MKRSQIPSVNEPCSGTLNKRRRIDGLGTSDPPPPLAFSIARCDNEETVCYGMIDGLPIQTHPHSILLELHETISVDVHSDRTIRSVRAGGLIGSLNNEIFGMIEKLAHGSIECQLSVAWSDRCANRKSKAYLLDIILYGPKSSVDSVGLFTEQCLYNLQDPYGCDRNVPYINPHRLSSMFDDPLMTYAIQQPRNIMVETFKKAAVDALTNFETSETLEQDVTPSALVTKLQLHQRQALTFFRRRELGLGVSNIHCGIWQAHSDGSNEEMFLNVVTDQETLSKPPVWRGGILADEMGLGKTLSMIALIASDKDDSPHSKGHAIHMIHAVASHSTLVIVPPTVLSVWESQLARHVRTGALTWARHQGKTRISSELSMNLPDVILTTYQTVESEYRRIENKKGPLASVHWKRVILDEAHIIRNWKTSTAKAIASLTCVSRWAISATPVQNGLQDLLGLFKFLQFRPYNDIRTFDADITGLNKNRTLEDSMKRLNILLACVMIRRTKITASISLPPKSERVVRLRFTQQEKTHYEMIETPSAKLFNNEDAEAQASGPVWLSVLQQIHSLRLICNLGIAATPSRPEFGFSAPITEDSASRSLSARLLMGDLSCQHCRVIFDLNQDTSGPDNEPGKTAYYSACYKLFCVDCAILLNFRTPNPCECPDLDSGCTLQPIPLRQLTPVPTPMTGSPCPTNDTETNTYFSTKVIALSSDIMQHLDEKSVVFSFWTSSLDMVERALKHARVNYVRIDGRVPSGTRNQLLEKYRNDSGVKVMLITTSCGAVGIDLTSATRAYLLEPQWNPTVEEQAMARIHRIGQTRPVTTIKYIMEDSIEEHILDVVQDRKKLLTSLLLPAAKLRINDG